LAIGDWRLAIAPTPVNITNQELPITNHQSPMKTVSSRQNPIVRAYRDLADEPDPNGARLLLDGAHLVREAQAASLRFESVAAAVSHLAAATEEGSLALELEHDGVEVVAVDDQVFSAMSPVHTPSGIVAIAQRHPTTAAAMFDQAGLFVLVVADVQDPGNLGSLLRVAEAGGVTGVIVCGESANPFSWKAVRGSMGSVLRLPVARSQSLERTMTEIREAGATAIAAVPRDGSDPDAVDWSGRIALLLGGEGPGLDPRVVAECNQRVSVPMAPPVESLNVAAAGAILVYAARRSRP
jgi:TrmH family RNA methyltransferase